MFFGSVRIIRQVLQHEITISSKHLTHLFTAYLRESIEKFKQSGICTAVSETYINNGIMLATRSKNIEEEDFIRFNTMTYCAFLKELAQTAMPAR